AEDEAVRAAVVRRICRALRGHMAAEEEYLYPAVAKSTGDKALVEHAIAEHMGARQIMERLEQGKAARDSDVSALRAAIEAHVAEEETELFAAARRAGIDLHAVGRVAAARRADV